ncbi:MAG: hypothetical protein Fur0018_17750 [Anaerolineales bacterium]
MKKWQKVFYVLVLLAGFSLAVPYRALAAKKITDPRELCKTWHTVVRGEDLTQISAKYNTNVLFLVYLNKIPNPDIIYPGQQLCVALKVHAGKLYMVSAGETLHQIAEKTGADEAYLVDVNHLSDSNNLYAGQVLYIPKGHIFQSQ